MTPGRSSPESKSKNRGRPVHRMYSYLVILSALALLSSALPEASVYLQSQKGGENVHVHVKNFKVHVIIADETSNNNSQDDYDYDTGHFTLKPTGSSSTTPDAEDVDINLSLDNHGSETTASSSVTEDTSSTSNASSTPSTTSDETPASRAAGGTSPLRPKCAPGYARDSAGKCRKN